MLAQNLREHFPELVSEGRDGYLSVNYGGLSAVNVQAVRELTEENRELRAQLAAVEDRLARLEALLTQPD